LKRETFIKELKDAGIKLKRHGKKHDIYFITLTLGRKLLFLDIRRSEIHYVY